MFVCSPAQRAIIEQPVDLPALLVIAGAGSGKTQVLCQRIVHLIERRVEPDAIAAVTFTQLAAAELRERVHDAAAADVWTGPSMPSRIASCMSMAPAGATRAQFG